MPLLKTKNFGDITFEPDAALRFPRGLPGFDDLRLFLPLQFADTAPLLFLQSVETPELCFVTLPILAVDPGYRLQVETEDRQLIGLGQGELRIGEDLLCLAVISLREDGPTANLLAPVVVNLQNRLSVQAVAAQSGYSHQQPLVAEEAVACS
jgi:flagellar assembly factor FliW